MPQAAAHDIEVVTHLSSVVAISVIPLETDVKTFQLVMSVEATLLELAVVSIEKQLEWTALAILNVVTFAAVLPKDLVVAKVAAEANPFADLLVTAA